MKVLYHLPIIPPQFPQAEALSQEIEILRHHFEGHLLYLNPNLHTPVYVPRFLFGLHRLREIRQLETVIDLHHIYNPDPFAFPIIRWLRRPVVYSISGGVGKQRPNVGFLNTVSAVTVPDSTSLRRLQDWGVRNVSLVRAGINIDRFTHTPVPLHPPIRLMMGSAPWTLSQFHSKGIDALLEAAQQAPYLHLVFLWRGVLHEKIMERIRSLRLQEQIVVLDGIVDVNQVLATVHASIVLATDADIVRAHPHSLLDSLAAGKPVLVSRTIPMADYVEDSGCGQVVQEVTSAAILDALHRLIANYAMSQQVSLRVGRRDFSQEGMIASVRDVYEKIGKAFL